MANTVIVHGPMACGKTSNKHLIAAAFGCESIVDDWEPEHDHLIDGALHLTNSSLNAIQEVERIRAAQVIAFTDLDLPALNATVEEALPEGDYAIVEVMGHRTLVGRLSEVERFGTKFAQIEPIFQGELLAPVMIGGQSIYQLTPCSAFTAFKRAPTSIYGLPPSVAANLPATALPAPSPSPADGDGIPF
ncbi:MAG: hypothetical protein BGP16_12775 [Sphingobium sp. 66-54]|nr:MAG: hypothetical protein BGP16_12775 [Sphingobium sp. 66-54]